MGRAGRIKPKYLAKKLKFIREGLEIETFVEMIARLDYSQVPLYRSTIYEYETGEREPPLPIILRYAQLANVYVEVLIDDELDFAGSRLPYKEKSEGVKRR